jgi:hypothetical protein
VDVTLSEGVAVSSSTAEGPLPEKRSSAFRLLAVLLVALLIVAGGLYARNRQVAAAAVQDVEFHAKERAAVENAQSALNSIDGQLSGRSVSIDTYGAAVREAYPAIGAADYTTAGIKLRDAWGKYTDIYLLLSANPRGVSGYASTRLQKLRAEARADIAIADKLVPEPK